MANFQRRGRPRKDGDRFPSGNLKPKSEAEREKDRREAERQQKVADERRMAEDKHLIHSQPHRQGGDPTDGSRESPLGRFVAANRLKDEIHIGADKFGALVRRWRGLNGVPSDIRVPRNGPGGGEEPSVKEMADLATRIEAIRDKAISEVMQVCGKSKAGGLEVYEVIRAIVVDGRDMIVLNPQPVVIALRTIAVEMGALTGKDHPFARRAA